MAARIDTFLTIRAYDGRVQRPAKDEGMPASVDRGPAADTALLRIRRAARAPLGALLLVIAVLWLWAAIHGIVAGDSAIIPGLGAGGAYLVGALGAALALLALDWIVRGRTVVISHGTVAVTDRSLRGGRAWREPLANYTEIRAYRELRTHRAGVRSWYVVRLWHPEPAKAIELARAKDPALIERRARDWAGRLGPAAVLAATRTDHGSCQPWRATERDRRGDRAGKPLRRADRRSLRVATRYTARDPCGCRGHSWPCPRSSLYDTAIPRNVQASEAPSQDNDASLGIGQGRRGRPSAAQDRKGQLRRTAKKRGSDREGQLRKTAKEPAAVGPGQRPHRDLIAPGTPERLTGWPGAGPQGTMAAARDSGGHWTTIVPETVGAAHGLTGAGRKDHGGGRGWLMDDRAPLRARRMRPKAVQRG